ncbi:peptide-methionine (S)-S-oxide reductase MsrA [Candidatus Woesearchaeota archaeon]|nr:peptide-methionine (S)-S-oxide reductase MsrA [Candidatus Woesearchaeota archaeon]
MKATFGAGCFWHVQESFDKLEGVKSTEVGYMGGHKKEPSYKEVCRGETGHTEVCQVEYDPKKVSYNELLDIFWNIHDPFYKAKTQYRSVIFYHSPKQKELAEKALKGLEKKHKRKPATDIEKAATFWKAEDYHQKYYKKGFLRKVCRM